MVVVFAPDVLARLRGIEEAEGMPSVEVIHQAVAVWSMLDGNERQRLGQYALGMLVERARRSIQ